MNRAIVLVIGLSLCAPAGLAASSDECPHHAPAEVALNAQPPASEPDTAIPAPIGGNKFPFERPTAIQQVERARSGSLAIRAIQGTAGGPIVANAQVEVELFHRGMLIDVVEDRLDEHGVVIIEDLPISMGLQPVVKVAYADVTYQVVGAVMDPANPHQTLEVMCFELTDEKPAWKVRMRHVMIAVAPEGLQVTEVMAIDSSSDRTWTGTMRAASDRAVTTEFAVPKDALSVSLGRGFHDWCCTTLADGRLLNHLPLMPQTTEMIYGYVIPSAKGRASIEMVAPAQIEHLMVLVPAELDTVSVAGLVEAGTDMMGDVPVRMYMSSGMNANESAVITLAGLSTHGGEDAAGFARTAAIIGGIVILLLAGRLILRRPSPKQAITVVTPTERDAQAA